MLMMLLTPELVTVTNASSFWEYAALRIGPCCYAVLQPDSSDDPTPLVPKSEGSQGGEPIAKAMEPDEAASALGFLALECRGLLDGILLALKS